MKTLLPLCLLFLFSGPFAYGADENDKPVAASMAEMYATFKALHPYMLSPARFEKKGNEEKIEILLKNLNTEIQTLSDYHTKFAKDPELSIIVESLETIVQDGVRGFQEGRKRWALWRLKTASNRCVTCHVTYKEQISFFDSTEPDDSYSPYERGEFFLATRQFRKAKEEFFQAAVQPSGAYLRIDALRKWLIIETRVTPEPAKAEKDLMYVLRRVPLLPFEKEEVKDWIRSMQRWQKEKSSDSVAPLRKSENLLRQALGMHDPLFARIGQVELLRATGLLHGAMASNNLDEDQKKEALFMLGLAYAKLPGYFINELPDFFLERCIRQYPGTKEAVQSFRLLKDLEESSYTGSGGTHLPEDVKEKLDELHRLAFEEGR